MDVTVLKDNLEERFLAGLAASPIPVDELFSAASEVRAAGEPARADSLAELLQDALSERSDLSNSIRLLELRASWHGDSSVVRASCRQVLAPLLAKGKSGERWLESAGFGSELPIAECFRRLKLLVGLNPGAFCYDSTWGFGVVRRADDFYQEVEIDFDRKPGHRMSFTYAAVSLELIGDDHILARKHRDPAKLAELVRGDPAEIVRIALRSYGPMNAARLQEVLVPGIVAESAWKPFWESARKKLKGDPLVEMPADRKSPIRLLERRKAYGEQWLQALKAERDLERVLSLVAEMEAHAPESAAQPAIRSVLAERLAYVIRGAGERQTAILLRAVMTVERLGVSPEGVSPEGILERFLDPARLLPASLELPAGELGPLLALLADHNAERLRQTLLDSLPDMQLVFLNEAMAFLLAKGEEKRCAERLRGLVSARQETVEILYWLARRLDLAESWGVCDQADLPLFMLDALAEKYSGERLKAANLMRELFEQSAWVEKADAALDAGRRRDLLLRLNKPETAFLLDNRSTMAKLIRLHPELNDVLAGAAGGEEAPAAQGGVTSWRAYKARQVQLQRLVNEEIPKNSREIALARSYGDLSENYEYKAAKEHQRLLMQKQMELERDLMTIRGSDFSEFPKDPAGVGTSVTVRDRSGNTERYHIMGEWDQDPVLGIVACGSQVAKALFGRRKGEAVSLPGEAGHRDCVVEDVADLPAEIRTWAKGG